MASFSLSLATLALSVFIRVEAIAEPLHQRNALGFRPLAAPSRTLPENESPFCRRPLHREACGNDKTQAQFATEAERFANVPLCSCGVDPRKVHFSPQAVVAAQEGMPSSSERQQTLQQVFDEAKKQLVLTLKEQKQWTPAELSGLEGTMSAMKLSDESSVGYQQGCGPDGMRPTAFYMAGTAYLCRGLFELAVQRGKALGVDYKSALLHVLAHEIGHALGPRSSPFGPLYGEHERCYADLHKGVDAQKSMENVPDLYAASVLAKVAREKPNGGWDVMKGGVMLLCGRKGDDAHASGPFRIDNNTGGEPSARRHFKCSEEKTCGLAGEGK